MKKIAILLILLMIPNVFGVCMVKITPKLEDGSIPSGNVWIESTCSNSAKVRANFAKGSYVLHAFGGPFDTCSSYCGTITTVATDGDQYLFVSTLNPSMTSTNSEGFDNSTHVNTNEVTVKNNPSYVDPVATSTSSGGGSGGGSSSTPVTSESNGGLSSTEIKSEPSDTQGQNTEVPQTSSAKIVEVKVLDQKEKTEALDERNKLISNDHTVVAKSDETQRPANTSSKTMVPIFNLALILLATFLVLYTIHALKKPKKVVKKKRKIKKAIKKKKTTKKNHKKKTTKRKK